MRRQISLEEYLCKLGTFTDDEFGRQFRRQFKDMRGSSELAMLQSPSSDEIEQLKIAVAIMTPNEKENAANLNDEQVKRIAADAKADEAVFAIFINGFALQCRDDEL